MPGRTSNQLGLGEVTICARSSVALWEERKEEDIRKREAGKIEDRNTTTETGARVMSLGNIIRSSSTFKQPTLGSYSSYC